MFNKYHMVLDDDTRVYLEKYKLLVHFISYQGVIFWTVFSIFLAANAIMLVEYLTNLDKLENHPNVKIIIPFLGFFISLFWLMVCGRDITLRRANIEKAKRLVEKIKPGKTGCLEIWDTHTVIEETGIKGLSGRLETILQFVVFIYAVVLLWLLLLWYNLQIYLPSVYHTKYVFIVISIGISVLIITFAFLDWWGRYKAAEKLREKHECKEYL